MKQITKRIVSVFVMFAFVGLLVACAQQIPTDITNKQPLPVVPNVPADSKQIEPTPSVPVVAPVVNKTVVEPVSNVTVVDNTTKTNVTTWTKTNSSGTFDTRKFDHPFGWVAPKNVTTNTTA